MGEEMEEGEDNEKDCQFHRKMSKRLPRWGNLNTQRSAHTVLNLPGNQEKPIETSARHHCTPARLENIEKPDDPNARTCCNKSVQNLVAVSIGPSTVGI